MYYPFFAELYKNNNPLCHTCGPVVVKQHIDHPRILDSFPDNLPGPWHCQTLWVHPRKPFSPGNTNRCFVTVLESTAEEKYRIHYRGGTFATESELIYALTYLHLNPWLNYNTAPDFLNLRPSSPLYSRRVTVARFRRRFRSNAPAGFHRAYRNIHVIPPDTEDDNSAEA